MPDFANEIFLGRTSSRDIPEIEMYNLFPCINQFIIKIII
jgi:hypothetical protein